MRDEEDIWRKGRETHIHTYRQTDRQIDRPIERQTD